MKKIVSWMLVLCLVCALMLQAVPAVSAESAQQKTQTREAMNALLVGMHTGMMNAGDVEDWTDSMICDAIHSKVLWDGYTWNSWLEAEGIDLRNYNNGGYLVLDRSDVDRIAMGMFGRAFTPVEQADWLQVSGDQVQFMVAAGEHTVFAVQDYVRQGSYCVAVGSVIWYGGPSSGFDGYFRAVFRENPDSLYGYTLVRLEQIQEDLRYTDLRARASSELTASSYNYSAANVLDRNWDTAWVEGVRGVGQGEWIELESLGGKALEISVVELDIGYLKNDDILEKNGWPTRVLIEGEGFSQEVSFDYYEPNAVLLKAPATTSWVRITILDAARGSKYDDTCISEIRLRGVGTDAYFQVELPEEPTVPETEPEATQTQPVPETAPKSEPQQEEAAEPQEQTEPTQKKGGLFSKKDKDDKADKADKQAKEDKKAAKEKAEKPAKTQEGNSKLWIILGVVGGSLLISVVLIAAAVAKSKKNNPYV